MKIVPKALSRKYLLISLVYSFATDDTYLKEILGFFVGELTIIVLFACDDPSD